MPIQDQVVINFAERAVDTDINELQSLSSRALAEIVRSMMRTLEVQTASGPPVSVVRPHIASGLQGEATTTPAILVNPGVLMQQVAEDEPDVPAPGALDSTYRFGLLMQPETIADPWDSTDSWWLLEARVVRELTAEETRDIYDPDAVPPTFAPSTTPVEKRYESRIEFQFIKDSNPATAALQLPTTRTVGWAPILGVWRPAAGGAIADADVIQLAWQLEDVSPQTADGGKVIRSNFRMRSVEGIGAVISGFDFELEGEAGGARLFAKSETSVDLKDARIVEGTSVAALNVNNTWGYVYLGPVGNEMPSGLYADVQHRGALVVSRTPPDDFGRNTLFLTVPNPLNEKIDAGKAVCIGLVRSAGATFQYINVSDSGDGRCEIREFNSGVGFPMNSGNNFGATGSPWSLNTIGPGGTEDVPYGVQLKCFVDPTAIDVTATALALETTFSMAGDSASPTRYPRHLLSTRTGRTLRFELYPRDGALTPANMALTITYNPRDAAMASAGTPGTNAYRAGIYGFRF